MHNIAPVHAQIEKATRMCGGRTLRHHSNRSNGNTRASRAPFWARETRCAAAEEEEEDDDEEKVEGEGGYAAICSPES